MLLERGSNHTFGLKKKSSISYAIRGDLTLIGVFFFGQGYGTLLGKNLGTAVKYIHIYVDV